MFSHPYFLNLMEGIRGRKDHEQFWGNRVLNFQRNSLKKARFSAWCKEGSEVKVSSTDLDIAEESGNFKITICGLTEQGINNKKNSKWFKTVLGVMIRYTSLWPVFHSEKRTQTKMQIQFVILFSYFMCEHINIALFCRLLMEFSCLHWIRGVSFYNYRYANLQPQYYEPLKYCRNFHNSFFFL